MEYDKYKDLAKRRESYKILRDKVFKIISNLKYNGYERGLASMVYKFFDKKYAGSGNQINNLQMNFISQLLKILKDAKSILLLNTIVGELILLICN